MSAIHRAAWTVMPRGPRSRSVLTAAGHQQTGQASMHRYLNNRLEQDHRGIKPLIEKIGHDT